jgi:hypothetical protein
MKFRKPCWLRSASVGNFDRSRNSARTFGMSSADIPDQSVAHATKFWAAASGASGSTASAPPRSPWPKISGGASRAAFGTRQMKRAS